MTITTTCSSRDLSGLVRLNLPEEVLVVLAIAVPAAVNLFEAVFVAIA